jgi:hypothetical protein
MVVERQWKCDASSVAAGCLVSDTEKPAVWATRCCCPSVLAGTAKAASGADARGLSSRAGRLATSGIARVLELDIFRAKSAWPSAICRWVGAHNVLPAPAPHRGRMDQRTSPSRASSSFR